MQWLCLHFHSLQLDSLLTRHQEQEPTVVVDSTTNQVVQLNRSAHKSGIKKGMGLAMSMSLDTEIKILEYKSALEKERLIHIAERLYQVTADIVVDPPQGVYLRLDNMLRLYKDLNEYWLAVSSELSGLNLRYHYATAPTAAMAKVLATSGCNKVFEDMTEARQVLHQLPIDKLFITAKQKEQLQRVGIKSISKLLAIPLKDMAKRFDLTMFNYLGQLSGELREKHTLFRPTRSYKRSLELMYEIINSEILKHPIKKMLLELETYLHSRNLVTDKLCFELCYRYNEHLSFEVEKAGGCYYAEKWLLLVRLKLESIKLSEPVVTIRLACNKLFAQQPRVGGLFNQQHSKVDSQELHSLLQAKLGAHLVNQLSFQPALDPNQCTLYNTTSDAKLETTSPLQLRPSFLLAKPARLQEQVKVQYGPERILTNWWSGTVAYRDYFIAKTEQGQRLWIYRTPQLEWYTHGYFS